MTDSFGRTINYLRLSVTDRCNLRCVYCMPAEGIPLLHHSDILTYDQIEDFTRYAVTRGITRVRLTGGEPLVRKGICTLISRLAAIKGIEDLSMTTNGQLLGAMSKDLREAGLHRLNISLDTLHPERYTRLSRGGNLLPVLDGIQAARVAGFGKKGSPIKLNCVLLPDTTEQEKNALKTFAQSNNMELRFIHCMDLAAGTFSRVEGGDGGNCTRCNRLRLTATGILKPCLFNELGYDIRRLGAEKAMDLALLNKPPKGMYNTRDSFYTLGG